MGRETLNGESPPGSWIRYEPLGSAIMTCSKVQLEDDESGHFDDEYDDD